jgi:tripartite-type tricarboxylate transporter receptor subunit TctC
VIGSRFVAASPPDGTTLLYTPSSLSLSVLINKPPPYDLVRDFTPIVNVAISPYALAVSPLLPVRSLDELLAHARSNPGRLSYGSAGIGSASHMAAELLKLRTGIDMVHVPNKGMNPALIDLIGNQVQVLFASVPGLTAEHSGRLKVLAMAERKRSALMPEVPTMAEAGVPDFAVANWAGLLGPAGLDPLIVQRLHDEVRGILATADMQERIAALGFDVIAAGPQEFAGQLLDDLERWGPVAKAAGADQR